MEWIAHPLLRLLYLGISIGCFFWLISLRSEKNAFPFLAILGIVIGQACFLVPAYCYGDAELLELWVLAIGIVCCLAELIIPGIGFFGIAGGSLFFGGAILVQVPNQGFDFSMVVSDQWASSISFIGAILVLSLAALLVLNKYIASSSFLKPFSQSHTLTNQKGYEAHHNQDLVSK
jgi:membrane-bound ClpP family serine protease